MTIINTSNLQHTPTTTTTTTGTGLIGIGGNTYGGYIHSWPANQVNSVDLDESIFLHIHDRNSGLVSIASTVSMAVYIDDQYTVLPMQELLKRAEVPFITDNLNRIVINESLWEVLKLLLQLRRNTDNKIDSIEFLKQAGQEALKR